MLCVTSVYPHAGHVVLRPAVATVLMPRRFREYAGMVQDKLMPKYNAVWHWAKIEVPQDPQRLEAMRQALAQRFPVARFNAYRALLDPDNILGNRLVDTLLGQPGDVPSSA